MRKMSKSQRQQEIFRPKAFIEKQQGNISSNSSNLFTYRKDDTQQQSKPSNPAVPICLTFVPISVLTLSADAVNKPII